MINPKLQFVRLSQLAVATVVVCCAAVAAGTCSGQSSNASDPMQNLEFDLTSFRPDISLILKLAANQPSKRPRNIHGFLLLEVKYDPFVGLGDGSTKRIYFGMPRAKSIAQSNGNFVTAASKIDGNLVFSGYVIVGKTGMKERAVERVVSEFLSGGIGIEVTGLRSWLGAELQFYDRDKSSRMLKSQKYVLPQSGSPVFFVCMIDDCSAVRQKLYAELVSNDRAPSLEKQKAQAERGGKADSEGAPGTSEPARPSTAPDQLRGSLAKDPVSVKVRVLSYGSGKAEASFQVRAVADCAARSTNVQARVLSAETGVEISLPGRSGKQRESLCFVVRARATDAESCFIRLREEIEILAKAGVSLDLPAEFGPYRCPDLPVVTVRFMDETGSEISLSDLRRIVGDVKIAGNPLRGATLTQYPADLAYSDSSVVEFSRPNWIIIETPTFRSLGSGAELRISVRRNFVDATSIVLRLQTSAGTFEPNCQPILDVPPGQLLTILSDPKREAQVSTAISGLRFNALQERKAYELEQGPTRYIQLSRQGQPMVRFAETDRLCKLNPPDRIVIGDELRTGQISRIVRAAGTLILSVLTASNALKDVDPRAVEKVYGLTLEILDTKLTPDNRGTGKQIERQFLVEWLRASRPDGSAPGERASPLQDSQLFSRASDRAKFLNDFLYDRNANARNERSAILTKENLTTPADPAALDSFIRDYLSKEGFSADSLEHTVFFIGRTPADGGSVCSAWKSVVGSSETKKRRLVVVEFATKKMLERDPSLEQQFVGMKDTDSVRKCSMIPQSVAAWIGVFLLIIPDAVEQPGERDLSQKILTSLLAPFVGESR